MSGLVRGQADVQGTGQDVREPLPPFAHLYGGRHVKSAPRRDRFHAARAGCPGACHSAERQASGKRKPTQAEALTGIRPPVAPETPSTIAGTTRPTSVPASMRRKPARPSTRGGRSMASASLATSTSTGTPASARERLCSALYAPGAEAKN